MHVCVLYVRFSHDNHSINEFYSFINHVAEKKKKLLSQY